MTDNSSRDVKAIKFDVVKHDLSNLGHRLFFLSKMVNLAMTKGDVAALQNNLGKVRHLLLDIESQELPELYSEQPDDDEFPF